VIVIGEHPNAGGRRGIAEGNAEVAFDDEDLELEESDSDDPTAVPESRFREAAETARSGTSTTESPN
jgi:hypothetical protein